MSDESGDLNLPKELEQANARLPIDFSQTTMPLDMTVRSMALTLAQRFWGDNTIKEGNLYQQLKMDNKLRGPVIVDEVIHVARIFEMYLWGKWSQDIAGQALRTTLDEMDKVIAEESDKKFEGLKDEDPSRPHSGGGESP